MSPYESIAGIASQSRGPNCSAFEMLGWNPAMQQGFQGGNPGLMQGQSGFQTTPFQTNPYLQQQAFQQQNPFAQPGFGQSGLGQQAGFGQQAFGQPGMHGFQQGWPQPQAGGWSQFGQQQQTPWAMQPHLAQQIGFGAGPQNTNVITTRAVDIEVTIPAQVIASRNPHEIQAYILHVVTPTLLDALTKRALAQDTGQSVSFDVRNGCVARVGL